MEPGGQASDGLAPLGPAWRDVSIKYTGERSVEDVQKDYARLRRAYDMAWNRGT